jgi:predicted nucleotidyltransferase
MWQDEVRNDFEERLLKGCEIIKDSGLKYERVGIFGSYARCEYKASSDIDFVVVTSRNPNRSTLATIKDKLDLIGCDITLLSTESFNDESNIFVKSVKRDYKEIYNAELL